jgi:hypothetical protein
LKDAPAALPEGGGLRRRKPEEERFPLLAVGTPRL